MLLFGHPYIPSPLFYHIATQEAIEHTPPNSYICIEFHEKNLDIIRYMQEQKLSFALICNTVNELIFAHNLDASFIVVESDLGKTAQKIAENYLFDAKILVRIHSDEQIETLAFEGIDGGIFKEAVIKI